MRRGKLLMRFLDSYFLPLEDLASSNGFTRASEQNSAHLPLINFVFIYSDHFHVNHLKSSTALYGMVVSRLIKCKPEHKKLVANIV